MSPRRRGEREPQRSRVRYLAVFALVVALLTLLPGTALAVAPQITDVAFTGDETYVSLTITCTSAGDGKTTYHATIEDYVDGALLAEGPDPASVDSGYPYFSLPTTSNCSLRYLTVTVTATNDEGSDTMTVDNAPTGLPVIDSVNHNIATGWGRIGDEVVLYGSGLGDFHDHADVYFMPGNLRAETWSWWDDEIGVVVPKGAKDGTVHVVTPNGTSNEFPFDVVDNVSGYIDDGHADAGYDVQDAHVELFDKAAEERLGDDYTDEDGWFALAAPLETGKQYRLKVTFESEDGLLTMQVGGDPVSFSRDFTAGVDDDFPMGIDCSKTDKIAEASTDKDRIDNCASVWHWLQLNRQAAQDLGYDLNATLTVNAFASDGDGTSAFYRQAENAIYLGSHVMDDDTHAASAATGTPDDADPAPWNFVKNRESHEFGHALMNVVMNGGWPSRNRVQNHAGYVNADTGDSLSEGFAELWTMVADDACAMDADPDLYDAWGHLATTNRHMAWYPVNTASPMAAATATTDYPGEEFAVAGLLRNLQAALGGGGTGFDAIVAGLPPGGTLTDLHDNLVTAGAAAATIDPLFFRYGFFADKNGNWTRDTDEGVGAGNGAQCRMRYSASVGDVVVAARPDRHDHPYEPNAFVRIDLSGVPRADSESWVTVTVTHSSDPSADYSRDVLVTGKSGLVYLCVDPEASAEVSVTGPDGVVSPSTLNLTYEQWTAARDTVDGGAAVTQTFKVDLITVGNPVAPKTMSRTRSYAVSGTLTPRHTAGSYPVRVYKYRYVSGRWKSYGYVKAKASDTATGSRYSCKVRLSYRGRWRLRAQAPADSLHKLAWSKGYDYVTVK